MPFKRNLIYFVCPFKNNNEWRLNIRELMKYMHIFNNKKIVVVGQGDKIFDISKVRKEFNDNSIVFYAMPNDKNLGEVLPFKKMMEKVYSLDPCEFTFYAHAKGVSPKYQNRTNRKYMSNIRIWRNTMYYFCLRDPNLINRILSDFSCCGCYTNFKNIGNNSCKWFFAGTYFWFNNKRVFSRDDWEIDMCDRYSVEAYLGCRFSLEESYNLFVMHPHLAIPELSKEDWNDILPDFYKSIDFEHGLSKEKMI